MNREEKSLFAFLKEYKDEPNVPDYTGEYPPPYELTQDDAELILNVKEKQDKEIERLNNIIDKAKMYCEDVTEEHENGDYNVSTTQLATEEHKKNIRSVLNILNGDLENYWRSDKE